MQSTRPPPAPCRIRSATRRRRSPTTSCSDPAKSPRSASSFRSPRIPRPLSPGVRSAGPAVAQPLIDTLYTSLAHVLMLRDGAILRPGTRAYARSWIRDGAMMSESLLRLGHAEAADAYVRWYATHQFADGKIPCCADARGGDRGARNDRRGGL